MGRHAAPIVVRLWKDYGSNPINALVHDWDHGTFTLPTEHPLAQQVWADSHKITYILTVLSTEELEWDISRVIREREAGSAVGVARPPYPTSTTAPDDVIGDRVEIRCKPRQLRLRRSLVTDEWLAEKGLVA